MDKIITIDGRDIKFRATARTPRLYRMITNRDMIKDMNFLAKGFNDAKDSKKNEDSMMSKLTTEHLMIFEDSAYVMAKHADPTIPEQSADEWLDTFNMFDIYEIFTQLMELWNLNTATTAESKKK
jgi:hypothetical protein